MHPASMTSAGGTTMTTNHLALVWETIQRPPPKHRLRDPQLKLLGIGVTNRISDSISLMDGLKIRREGEKERVYATDAARIDVYEYIFDVDAIQVLEQK